MKLHLKISSNENPIDSRIFDIPTDILGNQRYGPINNELLNKFLAEFVKGQVSVNKQQIAPNTVHGRYILPDGSEPTFILIKDSIVGIIKFSLVCDILVLPKYCNSECTKHGTLYHFYKPHNGYSVIFGSYKQTYDEDVKYFFTAYIPTTDINLAWIEDKYIAFEDQKYMFNSLKLDEEISVQRVQKQIQKGMRTLGIKYGKVQTGPMNDAYGYLYNIFDVAKLSFMH